ncbi:MAG: hypothetical protein ABII12_06345 [Planctomycetota bacterium]
MVETVDGKLCVGRILSEGDDAIQLKTGGESGPRTLKLPRDRIARVFKAAEEHGRIDACGDVTALNEWSAGYYHAGEETSAARCIKRVLVLDASIGEKPRRAGTSDYRLFWNRLVFGERTTSLDKPPTATLVKHAEWAHAAGLTEETGRFLRRALRGEPRSERIVNLAKKWGVSLEPRLRLDLTPALDAPLITREIKDDDVKVVAEEDKLWLTLPVRYDRSACPMTFSKGTIRGRDARGFYGVRALRVYGESPQFALADEHPIYERIDLEKGDSDRPRLSARNTLGPRQVQREDGKLKQPRLPARPKELPATGWIAIVLEIPESAKRIHFEWERGGAETIDLVFLQRLHDALPDSVRENPSSPQMAAILEKVRGPSVAAAALAIERLGLLRGQMRSKIPEAWPEVVDRIVVEAGARGDPDIRAAARKYMLAYSDLPPATAEHIAAQDKAGQLEWVALVKSHLDLARKPNVSVATQVLCAVLRSNHANTCEAALGVLVEIDAEVDWRLLERSSETAQILALGRLDLLRGKGATTELLSVLMEQVRPATADRIAANAEKMGLRIASPNHPLLSQWAKMKTDEERVALLTVLAAVDLGDVVDARRFADIVDEAVSHETPLPVREAAYQLFVRQARRAESRIHAQPTNAGSLTGGFQLLVSHTAVEPLVQGLAEAARNGSQPVRIEASARLLIAGYAEEVERALIGNGGLDGDGLAVLEALMSRADARRCYGMQALCGRLLRPKSIAACDLVFRHLNEVAADTVPADRWLLYAALKGGVAFDRLDELVTVLPPRSATALQRWLHELGHMTFQDRQGLAIAQGRERRRARLAHIDSRRGLRLDGRYGVIAILETTVSEDQQGRAGDHGPLNTHLRWRSPRRITMVLPPLRIESKAEEDSYRVLWGDEVLGTGFVKRGRGGPILRLPDSYSPRLELADESMSGETGWGWTYPWEPGNRVDRAVGPAVLPSRPVLTAPRPDTMTLEIGPYLREGLSDEVLAAVGGEQPDRLVPESLGITLRYAVLGSFYGVSPKFSLPQRELAIGQPHLLGVMLVLERID